MKFSLYTKTFTVFTQFFSRSSLYLHKLLRKEKIKPIRTIYISIHYIYIYISDLQIFLTKLLNRIKKQNSGYTWFHWSLDKIIMGMNVSSFKEIISYFFIKTILVKQCILNNISFIYFTISSLIVGHFFFSSNKFKVFWFDKGEFVCQKIQNNMLFFYLYLIH